MSPSAKKAKNEEEEAREVTLFRDYIRIKSVQPDPDYQSCMDFLSKIALELNLPYYIKDFSPGKPIMVMTWEGLRPELPSILLNSHTDVVPVYEESWKFPAFDAHKEPNGDIYGRGTQDMKCVTIQHLEAIRRLQQAGKRLTRTIHLSFMPEEEVGGLEGMAKFVVAEEFKKLNVGMALDEGIASPDDVLPVFYGERNMYWVKFICEGNPGHGSRFIEDTAAEKAQAVINRVLKYRETQKKLLKANEKLTLGDVTTVNLTMMSGGVQMNVVPNQFTLGFDMRVTPTTKVEDFDQMLNEIAAEIGVKIEFDLKMTDQSLTSVAENDPWYKAFKAATLKNGLQVEPRIFPAGTDSRFLREVGVPALGFSPMNNTPILLHDHNEFLNEKIFMRGIDIFVDVIEAVANV